MADDLDAIVDELGLPDFRVPAPRESAQHASAARYHSGFAPDATTEVSGQPANLAAQPAPHQHTRRLTRGPWDWQPHRDPVRPAAVRFAGIDIDEFYWAQQRARRAVLFWVVAILTLTGLVAAGAWILGSNVSTMF